MVWEILMEIYRFYRYVLFLLFIFPYMNFRRMISVYVYFQLKLENAKSEDEMINEWRKMNVQKIYLQNATKTELKYIYERIVYRGYKNLMIEILKNERMKIPDYYDLLLLLEKEGWEEVREKYIQLPRVKMHMKHFIEKKIKKIEANIGYRITRVENEECAFCLDLLTMENKIVECKTCRLKLDVKCWKKWILEDKNECLMCRSIWFHSEQIKEMLKWTEYSVVLKSSC